MCGSESDDLNLKSGIMQAPIVYLGLIFTLFIVQVLISTLKYPKYIERYINNNVR